jgi:hypothetical protein
MANKPAAKGRVAENGLVSYLQASGWPYAERRRLAGALDKGDVTGTPGVCWEAKYASGRISWWAWMRETVTEQRNAGAAVGVLVVKPPSVGIVNVHKWYAAVPTATWHELTMASGLCKTYSSKPQLYKFPAFTSEMAQIRRLTEATFDEYDLAEYCAAALTFYAPGKADKPETHIQVTHLGQMVHLLRVNGYGTPPDILREE